MEITQLQWSYDIYLTDSYIVIVQYAMCVLNAFLLYLLLH